MPSQNLVSAEIDPAVKTNILQQLADISGKLNFKVSLTPEAIKSLPKAGEQLSPFIDKAASVVNNHPEVLSRDFDDAEYKRDYKLMTDIEPIALAITELNEMVNNTLMAVKSDLFVSSLEVYGDASKKADRVPGLNTTIASMAGHFKRNSRAKVTKPAS